MQKTRAERYSDRELGKLGLGSCVRRIAQRSQTQALCTSVNSSTNDLELFE